MTLPTGYALAMDAQFRELANFTTPPRAGRITAIEGNGQVRVATDDPDGGDVLAWPLNGFSYAVNDVVYVAFAVNNPESAIVIGSKGATPTLSTYLRRSGADTLTGDWDVGEDRRILLEALRARDGEGIAFEDDAGNVGLMLLDGGEIVVVGAGSFTEPYSGFAAQANRVVVVRQSDATAANTPFSGFVFANNQTGTSHNLAQLLFMNEAIAGTEKRLAQVLVQTDGATDDGRIIFRTFNGGVSTDALALLSSGDAGFGTSSPQGRLHAHTGTGGMMFVTKSGVNGTVQTVLVNGSGDVTMALAGHYVWADGVSGISSNFVMQPGDNIDTSFNGNTWRIALNVNGTLTVQRTAGTGTGSVALMFCWI